MDILALFFFGVVQGLAEFFPISSSGHLVLFSKIFGIQEALFVSVILHVATLLSIVVVMKKELWQIIRHPLSKQSIFIALSTVPTCIIALAILPLVKSSFGGQLLPICFMISAILLLLSTKLSTKNVDNPLSIKSVLWMGIAQGFAVFPGVSRSGATICTGLFQGVEKIAVTKFSFLMSIPIILMSLVMEVYELFSNNLKIDISFVGMSVAFVVAFLLGIFAIKFMLKINQSKYFKFFAIYLVFMAVLSLFVV